MRSLLWTMALALVATALALPASALAADASARIDQIRDAAGRILEDPQGSASDAARDPEEFVDPVLEEEPAPQEPPSFGDRLRDTFGDRLLATGLAGTALTLAALVGFGAVTRYVSPKEALSNPQRAMIYGYVRGHPGVHLKQLSEEFAMKTSSVLWHVRKLEAAELVHSDRANGYRVFFPVAGGIEIRRVSRAITALHNAKAARIYESVERRAGANVADLATRLALHGGTVRWHLRKLREFGLVEELVRDDGSTFFPTPLGRKALETLKGAPVAVSQRTPSGAAVPVE